MEELICIENYVHDDILQSDNEFNDNPLLIMDVPQMQELLFWKW